MLIDTHCHVHSDFYQGEPQKDLKLAFEAGVENCILVGVDLADSERAVKLAEKISKLNDVNLTKTFAAIGIHPHEATPEKHDDIFSDETWLRMDKLVQNNSVVAIGECGFDFFYHKRDECLASQERLFRLHLELAKKHNLPVIFHVRDAFDDFVRVLEDYPDIVGVVHSFSAGVKQLDQVLGLPNKFYFGVNGIATFTKLEEQILAYKKIPQDRLVLETDAPYLTPKPNRGKMNSVDQLVHVAEFLRMLRNENQNIKEFSLETSANAIKLFNLR